MAESGAETRPDPTRDGWVIVRGGGVGPSLGRGAFPVAAADELLRHDLVAATGRGPGGCYALSSAGRAHLRRASADDGSEAFRAQHLDLVSGEVRDETGPIRVTLNAAESPLDWLRRRKGRDGAALIDAASFEAGERFRRDLTIGGILPSVTARWEGGVSNGGARRDPAAATDAVVAARQRVRLALAAVGGDLADLLIDLCGFLKGLETVERERGWPPRSAKVVVRLALRRLAEHYGLEVEARGPERGRGMRIWRDADERAAAAG